MIIDTLRLQYVIVINYYNSSSQIKCLCIIIYDPIRITLKIRVCKTTQSNVFVSFCGVSCTTFIGSNVIKYQKYYIGYAAQSISRWVKIFVTNDLGIPLRLDCNYANYITCITILLPLRTYLSFII